MAAQNHARFGRPGSVAALPLDDLRSAPLDSASGWRIAVPGGRPLATPAVAGSTVYVGGGFGSFEFYAFDLRTGSPRWRVRTSDDGPTAAVVARGRVAFNTESCTLFVVDADTGEHVWSRWLGDPLMSQPAIANDVVFMVYPHPLEGGHRLAAFRLEDGTPIWEAPIAGDAITAPVVDGDSVFASTFDGTVYRFRTSDGAPLWQRPMQATSAPTVRGDEVHVAERTASPRGERTEGFSQLSRHGVLTTPVRSVVRAAYLDPDEQDRSHYSVVTRVSDTSVGFGAGAPASARADRAARNVGQRTVRGLWEFQGSRPTLRGDRLYTVQGSSIRALDARTGELCWERVVRGDARAIGGHLATPPVCVAGVVVVATALGEIHGLSADNGAEVFHHATGEEIRFQPVVVGGRIIAGTTRGTLVCIDTGDARLDGWTMWGGGPTHNGPSEPSSARVRAA